jgi:nucleoid-associated protein YgaU
MRTATIVLGAAAAVAAGFSLFALLAPEPQPVEMAAPSDPAPPQQAAGDPAESASAATKDPSDQPQASETRTTEKTDPSFDVVRVERDGAAIVAGSAEPHADISIRVDGETAATAQADESGGFVAFFDIPAAEDDASGVRRVEVEARDPDGARTATGEPVIVAAPAAEEPDAEPLVVAARETGVEVLQRPGGAGEEGAVTLDSSIQQGDGVIALTGRAGGLKPVRIYANARLIAETVADADGRWTATAAADDAAGAQTLRIDEIAEDGSVSRRIETLFAAPDDQPALDPGEIVVTRGDTLWRIAENMLGAGPRYIVIYEANAERIRDPNLIFPGQVLSVPSVSTR